MTERLRKFLESKNGTDIDETKDSYLIYYLSPRDDSEKIVSIFTLNEGNYCTFIADYAEEISKLLDKEPSISSNVKEVMPVYTFAEGVENSDALIPLTIKLTLRFSKPSKDMLLSLEHPIKWNEQEYEAKEFICRQVTPC